MSGEDPGYERLREAFAAAADLATTGPDCSDTERIWAAVRGELPPHEAQALVDHALACPACGLAWRLARELAPSDAVASSTPRVARRGFSAAHWAAVAAAVIAAVVIPVGLHEWRAPEAPVYRADDRETVRSLLPDGGALARDEFLLRWTPGPPGTRYSLRLVQNDLSVVSEVHALEASEYLAPADALQGLAGGTELFWRVEAHLPDGSEIVSDTFSVRLE